ncbi:unnamed protein product [Ectocarpus sp. 12 AP-2014]
MGSFSSKEFDGDSAGTIRGGRGRGAASDEAASVIAGAGLTARVHLSLSCDGLANLDVGSKSDPFVVVSMKSGSDTGWSEIGRTEVVANNLSPRFVTLVPANPRSATVVGHESTGISGRRAGCQHARASGLVPLKGLGEEGYPK